VAPTDIVGLAEAAARGDFNSLAVTPQMYQAAAADIEAVRSVVSGMGVEIRLVDPLVSALPRVAGRL
jgi:hypothetical protein